MTFRVTGSYVKHSQYNIDGVTVILLPIKRLGKPIARVATITIAYIYIPEDIADCSSNNQARHHHHTDSNYLHL